MPHAPPAFIPAWAPTDPDMARHSSPTMSAPYRASQAYSSGCGPKDSQHVRSCRNAAVSSSTEHVFVNGNSPAAVDGFDLRQSAQGGAQGPADRQCPSPGRESYQSVPAVNINITGACACMSPARQSASTDRHEQAHAAEQHSAAKLNAEASLAYLHQPSSVPFQPAGGSNASAKCIALGQGIDCQDSMPQASKEHQASEGSNKCIDTAALQKEVTELRQQV